MKDDERVEAEEAPRIVRASELCAAHIGMIVRFRQDDRHYEVASVITAELRQLSADGGRVWIHVGAAAQKECTLEYDQTVLINPLIDYSDMSAIGFDPLALP